MMVRWVVAALALGAIGCSHYGTSASGKGGYESVAVPLLENESLEPGVHQALTDSLIQAFVTNGAMRVSDESQARIVLRGTIREVREAPFTYGEEADQYQISIFLDASAYDTFEKKTVWEEERMRGYGVFSASVNRALARSQGLGEAIRMPSITRLP